MSHCLSSLLGEPQHTLATSRWDCIVSSKRSVPVESVLTSGRWGQGIESHMSAESLFHKSAAHSSHRGMGSWFCGTAWDLNHTKDTCTYFHFSVCASSSPSKNLKKKGGSGHHITEIFLRLQTVVTDVLKSMGDSRRNTLKPNISTSYDFRRRNASRKRREHTPNDWQG